LSLLKKGYIAIVYSNVWISFGALCFTLFFAQISQYQIPTHFLGFVFFSTLFAYNFQRIVKIKINRSEISGNRAKWINQNINVIYAILILSFGLTSYFAYFFIKDVWIFIVLISFLSFFYVWKIPFLKINLRNIPTIKIYVLALTWVLTTVILPLFLFGNLSYNFNTILLLVGALLFIISITIPFDIRDVNLDHPKQKTIPQIIGVKKSVVLAIVLLIISHSLFMFYKHQFNWAIFIHLFLSALLIGKTKINKHDLFFSGGIDGLLITLYSLTFFPY